MTIIKKTIYLLLSLTLFCVISTFVFADELPEHNQSTTAYQVPPSTSSLLSNRYTQEETYELATNPYVTLDGYTYIGNNDDSNIELYIDETDLSFRVIDLETNYIWGSSFNYDYFDPENPLYDEGDVGSNLTWQNKFNSAVILNYYVGTNLKEETMNPSTSDFTFEPLSDGRIGFKSHITFKVSKVELDLYVYIDDEGLHYEVPYNSIVDNNASLATITIYPFFAATKRMRTPGYVMIPDGIGALIRIDDSVGKNVYTKKFYGADLGTNQENNEEYLYANVYGLVQGVNQNAVLSIIENGAGNAVLTHIPSQNQSDMNWTYVTYEYRSSYTQFLNQSQTNSVRLVQTNKNIFNIKQTYKFLNGSQANYVGMANTYQQYLVEQYHLQRIQVLENISLHLDVLAAENEKALFGRKTFSMTTTDQLEQIINDLMNHEINQLDITYHGYGKGGYSYEAPNYEKFEKKVGSKSDFIDLNQNLNNTTHLFYSVSYPFVSNTKTASTSEIAQTISQEIIEVDDKYYIYQLEEAEKKFKEALEKMQTYGVEHISFNHLGQSLITDFTQDESRSSAIETYQSIAQLVDYIAIEKPFSYLWFADVIYDIPMYSSQQTKFNDTVPFYSIVLSGYQTVYGRASNFYSNKQNELLRLIDYSVYPSFYITAEPSYLLLDSGSSHIFTSKYSDWQDEIYSQYNYVNQALKNVIGQTYLSREIVDLGVVKNTYSNGVIIYINYSGEDVIVDQTLISAMDYEVVQS